MSVRTRSIARLPGGTRAFHWLTVGLVTIMFGLAWGVGWAGPGAAGSRLVDLHRSFGVVLFVTVLARLGWRLIHPLPSLPGHVPRWERRLAAAVQALLYAGLLAMPLIGWAASDRAGDTVRIFGILALPSVLPMDETRGDLLFAVHGWIAIAILNLVALHVAGALRHRFIKDDGVLERMV